MHLFKLYCNVSHLMPSLKDEGFFDYLNQMINKNNNMIILYCDCNLRMWSRNVYIVITLTKFQHFQEHTFEKWNSFCFKNMHCFIIWNLNALGNIRILGLLHRKDKNRRKNNDFSYYDLIIIIEPILDFKFLLLTFLKKWRKRKSHQ